MIEVLQPGLLTTIQDKGRRGYEAQGFPPSGSFDPFLASIANRLIGNTPDAAVLEFALVGPSLKFRNDATVAVAGFGCRFLLEGKPVSQFCGFRVSAGSVLQFQSMEGWFGYLAISGGIEGQPILGSMSAYLPGRIGKRLESGDILKMGNGNADLFATDWPISERPQKIPLVPALHTQLFSQSDRKRIVETGYRITAQSNRMGLRLAGPPLEPPLLRRSCPVLNGAVQVPHSGQPIIVGPDGPTTGGYPQIAVIARVGWTLLASTSPGNAIEFEWTSRETAQRLWRERDSYWKTEDAWVRLE